MYTIYGNSEAAKLHSKGLRQMDQRRVARASAEVSRSAGVGAADVNYSTPALLFQVGNGCPSAA